MDWEAVQAFERGLEAGHRKAHGAFYTRRAVARFLARRALAGLDAPRVLDPACGAGAFLLAAHEITPSAALYGLDLMPVAVEQARALVPAKLRVGDALAPGSLPTEAFDVVLGNPPWGARSEGEGDSWERFVSLALRVLRPGGRLALVLPDTLMGPRKAGTRRLLLDRVALDLVLNLGPDWFGVGVRMSAVLVVGTKGAPGTDFQGAVLSGADRRRALAGDLPLDQVPTHRVSGARCRASGDLDVFRSVEDDAIIAQMQARSRTLASVCERGRGEELNKAGLLWRCSRCGAHTVPGRKLRGGGARAKPCPRCGTSLDASASAVHIVGERGEALFVDGDALRERWGPLRYRRMRLDVDGFRYKPASLYRGPKLLVRQAGVGLQAALDPTDARCPQSVYLYRLRPTWAHLGHELLLAALLSRTMTWYLFKRTGEVDPARAHAKVTHHRLAELPIPSVDDVGLVQDAVRALLSGGAAPGLEWTLRRAWGLSQAQGEHIDDGLRSLPAGQVVRQLFQQRAGFGGTLSSTTEA